MTQLEYIRLLFEDCGFDTVRRRADFMSTEFGRLIKFADELDGRERQRLVTALKDIKSGQQESARADWRSDAL
jgi:hypothetical protein